MRFESSLTRSTLSDREGRRGGPKPARRITTLLIALVLVILLMQQAGDPDVYRRFFARLGTPLAENGTPAAAPTDPRAARPAARRDRTTPPDPAWTAALRELPIEQLRSLAGAVRRMSEARAHAGDAALLAAGAAAVAEQDAALANALADVAGAEGPAEDESAEEEPAEEEPAEEAAAEDGGAAGEVGERLDASIAAALLSRIDDPTVLRGGERRSLMYWVAGRAAAEPRDPLAVGVLPLVDQADVYRGRTVRLTGRAVRTEREEAPENPFGVEVFHRVWLHPDDGSERPVAVLAETVPERVGALSPGHTAEDGPRVEAVGTFVTRLVYQSGQGVDSAPVIAGAIRVTDAEPPPGSAAGNETAAPALIGIVAVTAALGVIVAAAVYWYTEQASRARRALRSRATRPPAGGFDQLAARNDERTPDGAEGSDRR